jgi:hypothetical protein
MSSAAKIAANRRNAQKSTGPRSAAGKGRTRHNAFKHGLCLPASYDAREIETLAAEFAADTVVSAENDLALTAAEAHFEILRVRRAKVDLINGTARHLKGEDVRFMPEGERAALAFALKSTTLSAFDRYERRALARRNRALRNLRLMQRARQRAAEQPGPARPRQRTRNVKFDRRVLWLPFGELIRSAVQYKEGSECWFEGDIRGRIILNGDRGSLDLFFVANGDPVVQNFTLTRMPTRIGGGKWLLKCPETHQLVQNLYLAAGEQRLRSRHALKLSYSSKRVTMAASLGALLQVDGSDWSQGLPRPAAPTEIHASTHIREDRAFLGPNFDHLENVRRVEP